MKKLYTTLVAVFAIAQFSYAQWTTSGNNIYNSNTENVGIGTSAPVSSTLQVASYSTVNPAGYFYNYSTGDSRGLVVEGGSNSSDFSADFRNKTGVSRLFVRGDGNIGIGTTTPVVKLMICSNGSIGGTNNFRAAASVTQGVFSTDDEAFNMGPSIGFGSSNKFSGATNPYLYGVIRGAKESPTASNDYAGYLAFYTIGASSVTDERLRISSTGNVGIGTTTPDEKLTVKDDKDKQKDAQLLSQQEQINQLKEQLVSLTKTLTKTNFT